MKSIYLLLMLTLFYSLAGATEAKGPVVDLGTLDIEGESRVPNLQFIEAPAIKHAILQKVFTQSIKNIEKALLEPAGGPELVELKLFIDGPMLKQARLKRIFTDSVKNVEATLLKPAQSNELTELRRL